MAARAADLNSTSAAGSFIPLVWGQTEAQETCEHVDLKTASRLHGMYHMFCMYVSTIMRVCSRFNPCLFVNGVRARMHAIQVCVLMLCFYSEYYFTFAISHDKLPLSLCSIKPCPYILPHLGVLYKSGPKKSIHVLPF